MIEKYYRRMLDNIPTAVIVADDNLKIVFVNATFKKLFPSGYNRGKLGKLMCCTGNVERCGEDRCSKNCGILSAFEECMYARRSISRRVYMHVRSSALTHEVSFNINITPLADGLYMGVLDNTLELEIARELQSAKNIQERLLPAGKWVAGKRYSYTYIPCRDIGGDLPEVYEHFNSAYGVIADVSGKGISAGMLTAFVKAGYDKKIYSPAEAITDLNAKFKELGLDERSYITLASVRIDEDSVTYSMAGHNVPILLKSNGGITRISINSPPVSNWFDSVQYFEETVPYQKGDILVLLTDGVTESKNSRGEMFGEDGAIKVLSLSRTSEEFVRNLEKALRDFAGTLNDDITAIAFDL